MSSVFFFEDLLHPFEHHLLGGDGRLAALNLAVERLQENPVGLPLFVEFLLKNPPLSVEALIFLVPFLGHSETSLIVHGLLDLDEEPLLSMIGAEII